MRYNNLYIKLFPQNEKKNVKIYNYGLAILKSLLSFLVILTHYFNPKSTKNKLILNFARNRRLHVPSFFIMSFYFMQNNLLLLKMKIILNRFLRLLIPYIGWPCIIWKINHIINIIFSKRYPDTFNDLKQQLMWGRLYLSHMWFQWNLIAITFVFIIIIFIFRRHYLFIMQIILILSYISQYSGYYLNNKFVN